MACASDGPRDKTRVDEKRNALQADSENPTIDLILCSRKNEAIAKYSVLSEARQIFAAKYVKVLPTEQELTREIERERRLIDARQADE